MPLYNIMPNYELVDKNNPDIVDLSRYPEIRGYEAEIKKLREKQKVLCEFSVNDIVCFFDDLSDKWISDRAFLDKYSRLGISFLINFMKKPNLEKILDLALRGNRKLMDGFKVISDSGGKIMAHPKGVITHWIAGNVPVLGMLSLIQGILTKNANVVKVPRSNGNVLPMLLNNLKGHECMLPNGKRISGDKIMETILLVYCERDDMESQQLLSVNSDIRVAWGGKEAVESIMNLKRGYGTEDVIFGPKYSFAVIGKGMNREDAGDVAYRLALDASVFDQYGCNSPHTVFVERGGEVSPEGFAGLLASGMEKALGRVPKGETGADQAYTIVSARTEHSLSGKVFKSSGTEWTVIFTDRERGLEQACFSRVVFVKPVDNIFDVIEYIDKNKQTVGVFIDGERIEEFARRATGAGVDRITELGKMSVFNYPWDGMFPMDRLVRWVSLANGA